MKIEMRHGRMRRPHGAALLHAALLAAAVLAAGPGPVNAQTLRVVDGDTIRIGQERIRLWGIDAPEAETRAGRAATAFLHELLRRQGGGLSCERLYLDPYGRTVARCLLPDGRDPACELVRAGHAADWPRYSGGYYRPCAG
jgi:endonuclease YncB( thermonuclease family)